MKINKDIIKELVGYLEEFNLDEIRSSIKLRTLNGGRIINFNNLKLSTFN